MKCLKGDTYFFELIAMTGNNLSHYIFATKSGPATQSEPSGIHHVKHMANAVCSQMWDFQSHYHKKLQRFQKWCVECER